MSALTRTNSHNKKPYKDYVSFLDNYKTVRKDDQSSVITSDSGVNFSLTNSSNNSSNSVFSDISDAAPKNGFKEHLEHFNNRRNSPATLELPRQQKHAVKTEVFIEIKNPPVNPNYTTHIFEVQNIDNPQEATISVSNATKIFEKNKQSETEKGANSLQSKHSFSKKSSIGEISKKFEDSARSPNASKAPPKRAASIGEVSKIFENSSSVNNDTLRRPKNFNRVPKPFQPTTLPKVSTEIKIIPSSPKPAILSPKPVLSAPQFPKFTQEPVRHQDNVDSAFSSLSVSPSPPQSVSPPPVSHPTPPSGPSSPPPPPPPLPPANFQISKSPPSQNEIARQQLTSPQPVRNGAVSQKITVSTNEAPQQNGGTLNRNDPRVKKAVYGALRNMYGAYHDQANDYLATLPKNRVKKNNGLDNIINSIASQGGLAKLNGRANPNQEAE